MTSFFRELFDYNTSVNQELIEQLIQLSPNAPEKALYLQNHIINAHQIWNSRLSSGIAFGVYEIHSNTDLSKLDKENHFTTQTLIEQIDFKLMVNYTTGKGEKFSSSVRGILFHVINHSTYHRAQIAAALRTSHIEPLNSDYIFYKRRQV